MRAPNAAVIPKEQLAEGGVFVPVKDDKWKYLQELPPSHRRGVSSLPPFLSACIFISIILLSASLSDCLLGLCTMGQQGFSVKGQIVHI